MSASDLLVASAPTKTRFSFEVFPPRSNQAALALGAVIQHLAATRPEFISVTYGANGSHREATFDLLKHIRKHTDVLPMAHLTTVVTPREQLEAVIQGLMDAGIHDFLALRGDNPRGMDEADPLLQDSLSSLELINLLSAARASRPAFTSVGRTAVAVYPTGHPQSRSLEADIDWLLQKEQAGASLAITQLFFYAEEYLEFVAAARAGGVKLPILPGVMPVSTSQQLRKVAELAGQQAPTELERAMDSAGGFAPELGVEYAIKLCRELLAGGAPSLHLYTFNKHEQVTAVLRELELI